MDTARRMDPYEDTYDQFVMVPVSKKIKRCTKSEHGIRCQRKANHKGKHYFWKEVALLGWRS